MRTQMDSQPGLSQRCVSRRGVSTMGVVVAVAVVVIAGLAVAYFGSDVFRTRANAQLTQFTQWTPENIAKDPVNYLNFCEEQTNAALQKAKASEIAIAQKKSKIESMREEASGKSNVGSKALDELKVLYKAAEEKDEFPISWKGTKLDKDAARRQILKTAGEVKTKNELLTKLDAAINQLRVQSNKIAEARDNARDQLAKIDANREMLKVQQITDELKDNLIAMKAAIQTSVVGVSSTEAGALSLDDLAAQSETTVSDEDFNKVMNEK